MNSEKYYKAFDTCTVLHLNRKRVRDEMYVGLEEVRAAFRLDLNFMRGWNGNIIERYYYDVVFALYVPLHVYDVVMKINPIGHQSYTLKLKLQEEEKALNEILKESRTVPAIKGDVGVAGASKLEDILKLARSTEPRLLLRRKKSSIVKIDGEEYRRVVPIKPFIPLFRMCDTMFDLELQSSRCKKTSGGTRTQHPYKMYIEYGYFPEYSKIGTSYSEENKLLFVADTLEGTVNLTSLFGLLIRNDRERII